VTPSGNSHPGGMTGKNKKTLAWEKSQRKKECEKMRLNS